MDYTSGKGLEHKICQARNLFYLTDSAKETGTMDWEDLDVFCAAGCVEQDVVDDIKDTLMRKHNKTGFEFLDFVAYLPLFIDMQLGITNNPLAQVHNQCRRVAALACCLSLLVFLSCFPRSSPFPVYLLSREMNPADELAKEAPSW